MDAKTKTPGVVAPGVVGTVDLCQLHRPGIAENQLTPSGGLLQELAAAKCIPVEALQAFGVRNRRTAYGEPATIIDYGPGCRARVRPGVTRDGSHWGSRFVDARGKMTPAGDGKAAELPIVPYGVWWLEGRRQQDWRITSIIIGEGESDAWACWLHGVPYLGIPGATMYRCLNLEHVAGMATIFVHEEPNEAGKKFAINVAAHLRKIGFAGELKVFSLPDGIKDPADLHVADPEHFVEIVKAAMEAAQPAVVVEAAKPAKPAPKKPCDHDHGDRRGWLLPGDVDRHDLFALASRELGPPRGKFFFCPFHNDKHKPNLSIEPSKSDGRQRFTCHACGAHGDVLDFVERYFRLSKHEARKYLDLPVPPEPKCPRSHVGPEKAIHGNTDVSTATRCPNGFRLYLEGEGKLFGATVPCQKLDCPVCRARWNKERIDHFGGILRRQPELYRLEIPSSRWATVQKRLWRAEAGYVGVKRNGMVLVLCNRPIKEAAAIAADAACAELEAAITAVQPKTLRPVFSSRNWELPKPEKEKKFTKLASGDATDKQIEHVAERKGLDHQRFYWKRSGRSGVEMDLPNAWTMAQQLDFIRQCEGVAAFLGVQPDGKFRWTFGDDPRVWADDLPPDEPAERRDQEFLDQGSLWT